MAERRRMTLEEMQQRQRELAANRMASGGTWARVVRQADIQRAERKMTVAGKEQIENSIVFRFISRITEDEYGIVGVHYNIPNLANGKFARKLCLADPYALHFGDAKWNPDVCPYCRLAFEQEKAADWNKDRWRERMRAGVIFIVNTFILKTDIEGVTWYEREGKRTHKVGVFMFESGPPLFLEQLVKSCRKGAEAGGEFQTNAIVDDVADRDIKIIKTSKTDFEVRVAKDDRALSPEEMEFLGKPEDEGGPYDLMKHVKPETKEQAEAWLLGEGGEAAGEKSANGSNGGGTPAASPDEWK